ncbi:MAG: hypothetical protein DRQ48_05205, partial [Gammaproteobacteria bacterium]
MKIQIKKYLSDLNTSQKEVVGLVLFLIVVMVITFRSSEEVEIKGIAEPDLLITPEAITPESIIDLTELSTDTLNDIWPPLSRPWTGDLDGMIERDRIRVLTPFSLGSYYIDHGHQRGTNYEFSRLLEKFIKKKFGKEAKELKVIIIPVRRDQLIPYVVKGYGDIIMGSL